MAAERRAPTNREHFVGGARIMELWAQQAAAVPGRAPMPKAAESRANAALLGCAEQLARAQAWDAWCKRAHPRFPRLFGIPGALLLLKALEGASPRFSAWLDEPFDLDAISPAPDYRPTRRSEDG